MTEVRSFELDKVIHDIGLGELTSVEIAARQDNLRKQLQIGLERKGPPTTEDGGLLAIRTGIPPMTPEAWSQVPIGAKAFVADVAGTNWNVMSAIKELDGSISLSATSQKSYHGEGRVLPYADFIGRIAHPIAGEVINGENSGRPIDVGISLGFPHINKKTKNGIDAELSSVSGDGVLSKGWTITDWDENQRRSMSEALRKKLKELGINLGTLVVINDTPAVALDGVAVTQATEEGLDVVPAGFVGGTGTNGAVDHNGLVNLEIGFAQILTDEIFEKMQANGWINIKEPVIEIETGMYLPFRLAAGLQLLHEKYGLLPANSQLVQQLTSNDPDKDQALVSKIASGELSSSPDVQRLAQQVTKRAGQIYGLMLAVISEAVGDQNGNSRPKAFLVEGGTLLKGHGIVNTAEQTAAELEQPLKIVEAKGLRGIATLAMAYPFLRR